MCVWLFCPPSIDLSFNFTAQSESQQLQYACPLIVQKEHENESWRAKEISREIHAGDWKKVLDLRTKLRLFQNSRNFFGMVPGCYLVSQSFEKCLDFQTIFFYF